MWHYFLFISYNNKNRHHGKWSQKVMLKNWWQCWDIYTLHIIRDFITKLIWPWNPHQKLENRYILLRRLLSTIASELSAKTIVWIILTLSFLFLSIACISQYTCKVSKDLVLTYSVTKDLTSSCLQSNSMSSKFASQSAFLRSFNRKSMKSSSNLKPIPHNHDWCNTNLKIQCFFAPVKANQWIEWHWNWLTIVYWSSLWLPRK